MILSSRRPAQPLLPSSAAACHSPAGLLGNAPVLWVGEPPPAEPEEIGDPAAREVTRWTRCTTVAGPAGSEGAGR